MHSDIAHQLLIRELSSSTSVADEDWTCGNTSYFLDSYLYRSKQLCLSVTFLCLISILMFALGIAILLCSTVERVKTETSNKEFPGTIHT